jgi:hypothetical protein
MKAQVLIVAIVASLTVMGCSKSSGSGTPSATPSATASAASGPFVPNTNGPGNGPGGNYPFQYGANATFTPQSTGVLEEYAGHYIGNPQNLYVNFNLVPITQGSSTVYGGVITLTYQDQSSGATYIDYFTSGNSFQSAQYNVVYAANGGTVYHGFFTDFLGGLVAVIDPTQGGLGDGGGSVSGSIWFLNPSTQYGDGPPPPSFCWFVSLGPYDCQSWANSNGDINTYEAVNPNQGYIQLGTFTGLNVSQAFNGAF